jgi:hypothetical protein
MLDRDVDVEGGGDAAADEGGEEDADDGGGGGGGRGARRGCKNAFDKNDGEAGIMDKRDPEPGNMGICAKISSVTPSCFASPTTIASSSSKSSSSSHGVSYTCPSPSSSSSSDSDEDMGDESPMMNAEEGGGIGNSESVEMDTPLERLE